MTPVRRAGPAHVVFAHEKRQVEHGLERRQFRACAEALLDLSELDEKWLQRRIAREFAK